MMDSSIFLIVIGFYDLKFFVLMLKIQIFIQNMQVKRTRQLQRKAVVFEL